MGDQQELDPAEVARRAAVAAADRERSAALAEPQPISDEEKQRRAGVAAADRARYAALANPEPISDDDRARRTRIAATDQLMSRLMDPADEYTAEHEDGKGQEA